MNYKRYVLFFNICILLLLITVTFLFEWKPELTGNKFRPLDILSDVMKDSSRHNNTVKTITDKRNKKPGPIEQRDYTSYPGLINTGGKPTALFDFFNHLHDLVKKKRKKIRIGYFGDSMIEGDLVTQDIRKMLQENFGGTGVGFVPVTSIVAGFRQTITHFFSPDWNDVNFKSGDKTSNKLFLSGHSFFSGGNSVVTYRAVEQPGLDHFGHVSVLFGSPDDAGTTSAIFHINGSDYPVEAINIFNELELKLNNVNEVKMGITSTTIPVYGAAFEGDSGIVLDNFSFRGISGVELDYFSESYLKKVQELRPYDLLIFHYGPNLLFKPNLTDFSWYTKKMQPILQKLKNSFPQTSLMIISTADKGFPYDGEWHTAKGVRPLIDAQYAMARNTGIDFFNLFNAMGGEDAIVNWAEADTVLANKDYTHVNHRGAKKIAAFIFNAILKEYKEYEKPVDK